MKYALAFAAGLALGAGVLRAKDSSCCERVGYGVRGKVAGLAGPFAGIASTLFDGLGLTKVAPDLLDLFHVPKDMS